MPDHAPSAPLRKAVAANSATPLAAVAQRHALADAAPVQSLVATGQLLNARPALVAQRAMAEALCGQWRGGIAPLQRMNNGRPAPPVVVPQPAALAQGAGDQPAAANIAPADPPAQGGAAHQPVAAADADEGFGDFAVDFEAAFNGLKVATGDHVARNGPMYTTGLVNCIALIGYNPETPLACLYHWNTADGGLSSEEDEDGALNEDGSAKTHFVPDQAGVDAAKTRVDTDAPGATVYHAVLGTGWDADALAPVREDFVAMLTDTFEGITIGADLRGSARWLAPNLTGY